jgi:hypothetical protein
MSTDVWEKHVAYIVSAGIKLGLFDPENRVDMFLRNVGVLSTDYMALYPRK